MNTTRNNYLKESISWEATTDPEYPYSARIKQDNYLIRLNDFPAESLYTLIVNNEEVEDFEDWPEQWVRSGDAKDQKIEQTEKVRKEIASEPGQVSVAHRHGAKTALAELVRRIIAREQRAEEEMVLRYKDGIYQIIYRIVHNHSVAEDLCQETLMKALEKIRRGDVREPERLSGFILGIARYLAIDYARKNRPAMTTEGIEAADQVPSLAQDQFAQLWQEEKAEIVRQIINELKVERDREILQLYYIDEQDKEQICADLGLTRDQFNRVLFRAQKRYKELSGKINL